MTDNGHGNDRNHVANKALAKIDNLSSHTESYSLHLYLPIDTADPAKLPSLTSSAPTMTLIHIGKPAYSSRPELFYLMRLVLFKFRPEITVEHKAIFVKELKKLKNLSCVKDGRLLVGGPSVTDPIERSKGFQFALVSYHEDLNALKEYQASPEHHL